MSDASAQMLNDTESFEERRKAAQRKRSNKKSKATSASSTAHAVAVGTSSASSAVHSGAVETPRKADDRQEPDLDVSERTTLMLKNLPKCLSRSMLLDMLEKRGFGKRCDFVYLPVEFTRRLCMGYAFVNVVHPSVAAELWEVFDGLSDWPVSSAKICKVTWSSPLQGLSEHVERFRNSPLMHDSVPDECRPILLEDGLRTTFPPPTKPLRVPRPRASRAMRPFWQGGETGENADLDA